MKTTAEIEHECNRMPVTLGYLKMRDHAQAIEAKLSERKTVHEWLTDLKIPSEEMENPICLLRRLRITLDRYQRYEDALQYLVQATDCTTYQLSVIDEALQPHKDLFHKGQTVGTLSED